MTTPDNPERESLGKYKLISTLARGGMGLVFKGFDPSIERVVAIKTIHESLVDGPKGQELLIRFKREAQAAGRLSHPNVVTIYEYGVDQGTPFIAMEFIDGRGLNEYLEDNARFDLDRVVEMMRQILGALDYCHSHGVIHRDLKPANIIVLANGQLKITDFGIARVEASTLTQTGAVIGTPSYMSPEQFLAQPVDARSDLFSAAAILYELLTGERCFPGKAPVTIMHKVLNAKVDKPTELNMCLPRSFDTLVQKALAKRPADRYQSANAFEMALLLAVEDKLGRSEVGASESEAGGAADETVMALEARTGEFFAPSEQVAGDKAQSTNAGPKRRLVGGMVSLLVALAAGGFWWFKTRLPTEPLVAPVEKWITEPEPESEAKVERDGDPGAFISTEYIEGAYYAMINAVSEPAGADILVDGESFGETPLDFQLPPGNYELLTKKAGYEETKTSLEIEPGAKISLKVTLRKQ